MADQAFQGPSDRDQALCVVEESTIGGAAGFQDSAFNIETQHLPELEPMTSRV